MEMVILLLPLTVALLLSVSPGARALKRDLQIQNGFPADPLTTSFMVSLQTLDKVHYCGGAFIQKSWVLTAAHCNLGLNNMRVVAGRNDLDNPTQQIFFPRRLIPHPHYNSKTKDNDIMLIKVFAPTDPMVPTPALSPLPKREAVLKEGRRCHVFGWGVTPTEDERPNPVLHTAAVSVVSTARCNQRITHNMICAEPSMGPAPCQADSDSFLVCGSVLYGMVSWGQSCGQDPGVYTNVFMYHSWIDLTMAN